MLFTIVEPIKKNVPGIEAERSVVQSQRSAANLLVGRDEMALKTPTSSVLGLDAERERQRRN